MTTSGLILAAGAGTRFGAQTKQLADLRGKPLLQHAVDAMNAVLPCVVVLGHDADAIRARVDFGPARTVVCEDWARGQGFSLRRGVAELTGADAVAITLGDQPFITPEVIAGTVGALPGFDAVRAVYDGVPGHPVVLSRRVMDAVGELDADAGARNLLARFRVRQWEAGHLASAADIDTREELARQMDDGGGVCGGEVPPLIGRILTGTGLTLAEAAARLERGEAMPALTAVQRRIVEEYQLRG